MELSEVLCLHSAWHIRQSQDMVMPLILVGVSHFVHSVTMADSLCLNCNLSIYLISQNFTGKIVSDKKKDSRKDTPARRTTSRKAFIMLIPEHHLSTCCPIPFWSQETRAQEWAKSKHKKSKIFPPKPWSLIDYHHHHHHPQSPWRKTGEPRCRNHFPIFLFPMLSLPQESIPAEF